MRHLGRDWRAGVVVGVEGLALLLLLGADHVRGCSILVVALGSVSPPQSAAADAAAAAAVAHSKHPTGNNNKTVEGKRSWEMFATTGEWLVLAADRNRLKDKSESSSGHSDFTALSWADSTPKRKEGRQRSRDGGRRGMYLTSF